MREFQYGKLFRVISIQHSVHFVFFPIASVKAKKDSIHIMY